MNIVELATHNWSALKANPYPGRIVAVGRMNANDLVMMTAIMGRSDNSRNRVYGVDHGRIFTEAANPEKMRQAQLIIYNAMNELPRKGAFVASNGDQTDTALEFLRAGESFQEAMDTRDYEPDAPNWTPRISAIVNVDEPTILSFSAIRRSPWSHSVQRDIFAFQEIPIGYGYYLRTYETDGDPLPSYRGAPLLIPCPGNGLAALQSLWSALNPKNRIAVAGKVIDTRYCKSEVLPPINRFRKTPADSAS